MTSTETSGIMVYSKASLRSFLVILEIVSTRHMHIFSDQASVNLSNKQKIKQDVRKERKKNSCADIISGFLAELVYKASSN